MVSIDIKIKGLKKLENYFKDYIKRKKRGLLGVVAHTSENIKFDAQNNAPKDLGELKSSIYNNIIEKKQNIIGEIISGAYYSAYVEYGTRPHWAPYSALEGWSRRHGIPTYAVLKKIAEKGTPAQPFMYPAAKKNVTPFVTGVISVMSTK